MRKEGVCFREWLRLAEALDPGVKASLEKAPPSRFPDREFLRKAIEDMEREPGLISAPDAWKRLNALASSSGVGGKEAAVLKKLATIMPDGREGIEQYVQTWRAGRMSLPELYSLAFFAARGARKNALDLLAREMAGLHANWRKKINFSDRPEISTNDGVSKFDSMEDFSAAVHTLAASDLDMSGRLEFDPKTDIRPERQKDLVAQGGGVWIYKGPDPTMCRLYGKGGGKEGNSPWCVAQTSNTQHYFAYRIDRKQTFFFIFDTNKGPDDKARRVLAGVSLDPDMSEWGDMGNARRINGYDSVEQYKEYLAGRLGMSVEELDETMSPEPATDAEKRLKEYLNGFMEKQGVWEKVKNDKETVYGEPMLDIFLKMTEDLEKVHWDQLTPTQKKLPNPEIRLKFASTVEEAERAVKDGAKDFAETFQNAAEYGHLEVCRWLIEKLGDSILGHEGGRLVSALGRAKNPEVRQYLIKVWRGRFGPNSMLRNASTVKEADRAVKAGANRLGRETLERWLAERRVELVRWFLKSDLAKKEDLREYDPLFSKALNAAVKKGDLAMCKLIVGERLVGYMKDALDEAARRGHLEICRVLLDGGSWSSGMLESALYFAAKNRNLEVCKLLVQKGAKPNGNSLGGAAESGSVEMCKWFVEEMGVPVFYYNISRHNSQEVNEYLTRKMEEREKRGHQG